MNGRETGLFVILGLAVAGLLYSLTDSGKAFFAGVADTAGSLFVNRGIRNCNPGNIRRTSTQWRNSFQTQASCEAAGRVWDPEFVVFYTMQDGERAIGHVLSSYMARGLNTVAQIISTWAPPAENDTEGYASEVADDLSVAPETIVDSSYIPSLAAAIMKRETGYVEDPDTLLAAVYS